MWGGEKNESAARINAVTHFFGAALDSLRGVALKSPHTCSAFLHAHREQKDIGGGKKE